MRRFRGEAENKVDAKGRISIPAPFRRILEEGDPDWSSGLNPNLVIVYGRRNRKCLEGYSPRSIEIVDNLISNLPRYSNEREILERLLNSQSVQVQLDENGRIILPLKLRKLVDIESTAMFVGMGEKFQIWHPDNYTNDMNLIEKKLSENNLEEDLYSLLDSRQDTK
tara:strand:+ start:139 stop:639 length:501 start_codon:yes stop_codon:yes gene_type:complete